MRPSVELACCPPCTPPNHSHGWISEPIATEVARALNVPLADVHGVIEFYSMFYNHPIGHTIVRVCTDPACSLRGADAVLDAACQRAKVDCSR